jgi:hypothetical protein
MGSIDEKDQRTKISLYCPFKNCVLSQQRIPCVSIHYTVRGEIESFEITDSATGSLLV